MATLRLAKISSMYPGCIQSVYARHPGAEKWSYARQLALLMDQGGGWADFWQRHLEETGRFNVVEILINADPLQRAWAREHGVSLSGENWRLEVVARQVAEAAPDVLFPHDFHLLPPEFIRRLRRENRSIRRVIFYDGIAYCRPERFEGADLVLSCGDFILDCYREKGFRTAVFNLGFESSLLDHPSVTGVSRTGAVFTGSVSLRPYAHFGRLKVLDQLITQRGFRLHAQLPSHRDLRVHALKLALEGRWQDLVHFPQHWRRFQRLRAVNRGPVYGREMFATLAGAEICLNAHIDVSGSCAANMRLFEATGMACCLLTDDKENLSDLFEPDREVVTFRSADECCEKLRYLLEHPEICREIGEAGQRRTLRDYSLRTEILKIGEQILSWDA